MNNIYTFFIPHSPLMISKIGEEHSQKLFSSIKALKDIKQKIYDISPDKIFIITPPSKSFNNIVINQSEEYIVNFKSFGDLSLEFKAPGDLDYSTRLRDFLRQEDFQVNLFSDKIVDYGSFVPLYYLNKYHTFSKGFENKLVHDPNTKNEFIIINSSQSDLDYHWKFGELLAKFLVNKREKIVILACGDLLGPVKKKKDENLELANKLIDLLKEGKYQDIIKEEGLKKGSYPGIKPLMSIAPLISKLGLKANILSLDKEFNEIYLTVEFQ
jgi:aromatic ring-opening dioxygenase LigB subunit